MPRRPSPARGPRPAETRDRRLCPPRLAPDLARRRRRAPLAPRQRRARVPELRARPLPVGEVSPAQPEAGRRGSPSGTLAPSRISVTPPGRANEAPLQPSWVAQSRVATPGAGRSPLGRLVADSPPPRPWLSRSLFCWRVFAGWDGIAQGLPCCRWR